MLNDFFSSIFSSLWSIFLIVLFFGGSIFVHELGHFIAARRRGVKVERFSIGFGPAIWSHRARDGVEYRLAWIPLGGYVALPQLADMAAIEGESDDADRLPPITYSTRMIVFAAGAFCNVLFAFGLASILWVVGQPTSEDLSTTRVGYISKTITLADGTAVPSPALAAGIQVGDVIRAIDGTPVADWPELLQTLVTSAGVTDDGRRKAVFTIERAGQRVDLPVYPRLAGEDNIRRVGISPAYTPIVAAVPEHSFAAVLGLQSGDQLVAVDGVPVLSLMPLLEAMQDKTPRAFTLTVERDARRADLEVPAERPKDTPPLLGATYRTKFGLKYTDPFTQIGSQVTMTMRTLWSLIHPHSDIGISKLSGPIGIGKIYWDASEAGFRYVLWIAVLVNVNLAIFNLLPIPVLDGGHMLFATIGKLRGRALPGNFIAAAQSVFIVLLLTMILYVSVFDVKRIVRDNHAETQAREAAQKKAAEPAKP
ncbi:MAG: RIP metalloprotease RseP [Opitutaceae bacterium]|nr:RIP metalloprotease RseP [Opitutaceae bacterium]